MKGYVVENGYMGYLDGKYVLFADESDMKRCMRNSKRYVHAVPEHHRETMKLH